MNIFAVPLWRGQEWGNFHHGPMCYCGARSKSKLLLPLLRAGLIFWWVLAIYEEMIFAQGAFASEYVPGKKLKGC